MPYQVGDRVCLVSDNSKLGTITRLNPLGSNGSVVVQWDSGERKAYFGTNVTQIQSV